MHVEQHQIRKYAYEEPEAVRYEWVAILWARWGDAKRDCVPLRSSGDLVVHSGIGGQPTRHRICFN